MKEIPAPRSPAVQGHARLQKFPGLPRPFSHNTNPSSVGGLWGKARVWTDAEACGSVALGRVLFLFNQAGLLIPV